MFSRLLVKGMEWLLICIFGSMVVLVFGNVVLRYGFNYGIIFSEEVSRFLFVWMVFLGSVLMLRDNGHLGVHTLTKLLPLAGKKVCKFIGDATTLACCLLMTYGGWKIVRLNMSNIAPVSEIPLGVVYVALLVCSVGMGVLLVSSLYRLVTGQMDEQEMCPDFDDAL
ncbi:TRAP transporter small permease [Propionivibrio sp.]|jgi:TRAP-type C4-dicarboxylate transport system permease small subunit|uniref:TRAP transporter small permease n=1 Tax=Propionivibrio sp. TaxID=2212460 RepID=UPI0039E432CD